MLALARRLAWMLAAGAGLAALGLGGLALHLAGLPYNAQGRHFDGGVVHHAQSVPIYGLFALGFAAVAVCLVWLAIRIGRRRQA